MSNIEATPVSGADASCVSATGWGAEARQTFGLGWPLIVAQLAQNLLFTTDVVLMGWLGRSLLAAFDETRMILVITVLGVIVNALVAYTLIFGHFGFPRLELRGAAIATGTVNLVMFLAMLAYALRHRKFKRFNILTKVPMFLAIIGYWLMGLPIAYVLGFVLDWRGTGIWLGLAASLAIVAIVLVARFALRERLGLLRGLPLDGRAPPL